MKHCWAVLPYKIIKVSGKDNLIFLQGQMTQDMQLISENKAGYTACCNNKGRMINVFLGYKNAEDFYLRVLDKSLDIAVNNLKKYILRSKVTLTVTEQIVIGLDKNLAIIIAKEIADKVADNSFSAKNITLNAERLSITNLGYISFIKTIADNYYMLLVEQSRFAEINALLAGYQQDLSKYRSALLNSGEFDIYPENSEAILPQMTSLEGFGAISYSKGCYVGQEIVARSKYLGKTKRYMAIANIVISTSDSTEFALAIGDKVTGDKVSVNNSKNYDSAEMANSENIEIGEVVDFAETNQPDGSKHVVVVAVLHNEYIAQSVIVKQMETQFCALQVE